MQGDSPAPPIEQWRRAKEQGEIRKGKWMWRLKAKRNKGENEGMR